MDSEKNLQRQVVCALIPVSYVRERAKKWVVWRDGGRRSRREDGGENTRVQGLEKKKLKGRKRR